MVRNRIYARADIEVILHKHHNVYIRKYGHLRMSKDIRTNTYIHINARTPLGLDR